MIRVVCSHCGRLVAQTRATGGRCSNCSRQGGSTRSWRTLRAQVIARDGGRCTWPGCKTTKGLEVHHIDGNPRNDRPGNLTTYCPTHHGAVEGKVWVHVYPVHLGRHEVGGRGLENHGRIDPLGHWPPARARRSLKQGGPGE